MKKVLINTSNLHSGGAVAVATSFIKELSLLDYHDLQISLLISTEVSENLDNMNVKLMEFKEVIHKDYFGVSAIWNGLSSDLAGYDLVFTVFGPAYTLTNIKNHVVGFAQPNIIYPFNPIYQSKPYLQKVITRLKYKLQEYFFSKSSELIVELEHVKVGIKNRKFFNTKPIHIVNSAVDRVFSNDADWMPVSIPDTKSPVKLGIISRNYPHKNLEILPAVKQALSACFNFDVEFYVTFTEEEYANCSKDFQQAIVNVGSLKLAQCPTFYSKLDGVIFPSLLECFSAVPIEAMMIKKPLFASDLPFIKDCCGLYANYFDPLDPMSIAASISSFFSRTPEQQDELVASAFSFVKTYPGPEKRALLYLQIIENAQ